MGFPTPDVDVFEKGKQHHPGFAAIEGLTGYVRAASSKPGRSVILVHYAGHAYAANDELFFQSGWGKEMKLSSILRMVLDDVTLSYDEPVDFVFILDCCSSYISTRVGVPGARLVDTLMAGDERNPKPFGEGAAVPFTSRLLLEIRNRVQRGDKYVEIAEVMSTLREMSSFRRVNYAAKLGIGSVTFPLVAPAVGAPSIPAAVASNYQATFSVRVSRTFTVEELRGVVAWVESFPSNAQLVLERIKGLASTQ